jgi:hypothetical protein
MYSFPYIRMAGIVIVMTKAGFKDSCGNENRKEILIGEVD